MRQIFYSATLIVPDGSDTSGHGDGCEPGQGTTYVTGWISPDRPHLTYDEREEVAPDVWSPDDAEAGPVEWLVETLNHHDRLYTLELEGVQVRDSGLTIYSTYEREVDGWTTGNKYGSTNVSMAAHVEGFTEAELTAALELLARKS